MYAISVLVIFITIVSSRYSEPDQYVLDTSFNTGDNYLNIAYDNETKSNNYFIVIGDWGGSLHEIEWPLDSARICNDRSQKKVGEKIQEFIAEQDKKNKTLLFFVLVGDNFYYKGNDGSDTAWTKQWKDIYGKYTQDYYWFSLMGNHDYLNSDPYAMCPWNNTKHTITHNVNNKTIVMPYAGNQLVKSKKGTAPEKYYMPEYSFYYTINDLKLELIMLDTNGLHCPDEIYYKVAGFVNMGDKSYENCGNSDAHKSDLETVAGRWLRKLSNASYDMMIERANNSHNSNFIIANHYPEEGDSWLKDFNMYRNNTNLSANDIVVSVFGHTHDQLCKGYSNDSWGNEYCNKVLTGGGGGCCDVPLNVGASDGTTRGFYVFDFEHSNGTIKLHQPYAVASNSIRTKFNCGKSWNIVEDFDFDAYCPADQQIVVSHSFGFCNYTDYWSNVSYQTTEEADNANVEYRLLWLQTTLISLIVFA